MKNIDFTDFFNVFLSGATILCILFSDFAWVAYVCYGNAGLPCAIQPYKAFVQVKHKLRVIIANQYLNHGILFPFFCLIGTYCQNTPPSHKMSMHPAGSGRGNSFCDREDIFALTMVLQKNRTTYDRLISSRCIDEYS